APSRGALGDGVVLGPRVAPALIGLGLLEAIPESVLARRADPDDRDGDGISGRVHWLGDGAERRAGRFGWKATQPTVELQTAAAFVHDMGVTSPRFPLEPPGDGGDPVSPRNATSGEATPEIDAGKLDRVVFYTRMLAVPAARDAAVPEVRRGAARFESFGCAACHTPSVETGDDAIHPAYRRVRIRPYTDLLLHDLGPDLADEKTDGDARPSEWRTPPLWGVGLTSTVSGHTRFLHDGRARNLAEAVLWHGGEAEAARERFRRAEKSDRAALLRFLESL
ncbi:MAG TPA: di-heme oxidoredictase family protein, partial [Planctomycetota bacterium]|nr:di-heme oxidoredictase family protein [Planctomycetota bacterium]